MSVEYGKLDGDVRISEDLVLYGIITGNAVVTGKGRLVLFGIVRQDLILEEGSASDVYGMVGRDVRNRGGNLRVWGMVMGSVFRESGTTVIDSKAVIKGTIEGKGDH